jgi:hypothetical protein
MNTQNENAKYLIFFIIASLLPVTTDIFCETHLVAGNIKAKPRIAKNIIPGKLFDRITFELGLLRD